MNNSEPNNKAVFDVENKIEDACMVTGAIGDGLMWYVPKIASLNKQGKNEEMMEFLENMLRDIRLAHSQASSSMELVEHPDLMEKHGVQNLSTLLPNKNELDKKAHASLVGLAAAILACEVSEPVFAIEQVYNLTPQIAEALERLKAQYERGEFGTDSAPTLFCMAEPTLNEKGEPMIEASIGCMTAKGTEVMTDEGSRLWKALQDVKQLHNP